MQKLDFQFNNKMLKIYFFWLASDIDLIKKNNNNKHKSTNEQSCLN